MAPPSLIDVRNLRVYFPITEGAVFRHHVGDVRAVDGVSFSVQKGDTLGLVGESGCGKSTIGRALLSLTPITGGSIQFDGTDVAPLRGRDRRRMRRRMQMIFQDPYASLEPYMSIGAIIREPLIVHSIGTRAEQEARVAQLLEVVGLDPDASHRYPQDFSGGQRQRVGIARALALDPDVIVADEPVSALDVSIQAQILNLLARLQKQLGLTYVVIAHDLSVVRRVSNRVAVMYLGRLVELADVDEFFSRPLHPYSIALLSAVFVPDPVVEARRRRIILKGDVPSAAALPSGCRFHTRCWLREKLGNPERCTTEDPALRPLRSRHEVACHFAERIDASPDQFLVASRSSTGEA